MQGRHLCFPPNVSLAPQWPPHFFILQSPLKRNIAASEAHFWDCCSNMGHFLCDVARVKRYVKVYLHLYRQQPEMDNQNVDFAYPGKILADAHACVTCVNNLACALYFAI